MRRFREPVLPAAVAALSSAHRAVLVLAAAGLLAACNRGGDTVTAAAPAAPGAAAASTAESARRKLEQSTTAAVRTQASHATVEIRFALPKAPEPGAAFPLELSVLPGEPTPTLKIEVQPADGLALSPVTAPLSYDQVERGSVISVPLELTAAKDGVYLVRVLATEASPTGADSATFTIPVAVNPKALAARLAAQTAAQEAAKAAAAGAPATAAPKAAAALDPQKPKK